MNKKLWPYLLFFFGFLSVTFWGLYAKERVESKPVYDVLSIDEHIIQLRVEKFALCEKITTVPLDKLDAIIKTCWEHLQLQ